MSMPAAASSPRPTPCRALNNEPSVMQATRARVLRAIAELDYEPDPSARNLRSGT
ncbi:LacI family DNA-binding transcriptional regulator, partial [Klebsiella pneumoniae]|uniref:LacI family DNA-binding transcriptional regulator n=1 Tax=Klebsiella pneumoniae TaxID=573 RepID=UPI003F24FB47